MAEERDESEGAARGPRRIYEGKLPEDVEKLFAGRGEDMKGRPITEEKANKYEPTLTNGLRTIKMEDWKTFHKQPCVRESLMTAIASGFAGGGVAWILGKKTWNACNWAVGTYLFASFTAYQWCQFERKKAREGMRKAVEIVDRRRKEREIRAAIEVKRRAEEQAALEEEERRRKAQQRWYRFW
ncbi:hypothetical protein M501DRAFT_1004228 [Patellaria atrata CBS 101060]|uniref:Cytochrome c oxidase assembly protein COX20, mitochondrial n=1 Tax=Patellaria atrata CBS 101060 TaxID=1346257 RepID=A0A9P4S9F2_9PEZI|nr:hypothetical protein M501DRAFT_1004228 [Patellaria atrata CBS 101060]